MYSFLDILRNNLEDILFYCERLRDYCTWIFRNYLVDNINLLQELLSSILGNFVGINEGIREEKQFN